MKFLLQLTNYFSLPRLVILVPIAFGLNWANFDIVNAQEINLSEQPSLSPVVAQESSEPTEENPTRKRLRATFFEEERKQKFGFGDFLHSALDGAENAFADPAKISEFSELRDGILSSPSEPRVIEGNLTIGSRDEDDDTFLNTDFKDSQSQGNFVKFTDVKPGSDPRRGSLDVSGNINGQNIQLNDVSYTAGFSDEGDTLNGVYLVTDPDNPENSLFIQIPTTDVEGFADLDDSDPIKNVPANLSIGLPTDR